MSATAIPGYTLGSGNVPQAPFGKQDFELLQKTVLFTDDDIQSLRLSQGVLRDQVEAVLDVWYGFVAATPHLLAYFTDKAGGKPNAEYLAAVRKRFAQWILDTAAANYDQKWLDYQFEIGRRHHRSGKNKTDHVAAVEHIPFRYMAALLYPIVYTLKPFLAKKGHNAEAVEKMHQAWTKSVLMQVILWSYPYIREGDF